MNGTIAVTDYGWYEFLLERKPAEVNFWTPSDRRAFHAPAFAPFAGRIVSVRKPKVAEPLPRFGEPHVVIPRLGQGTFRIAVTEAYDRSCAVTGEHSLPALDAAHIQAYSAEGPHDVRNGILLRADLHRLFDQGYITITPDHRIEVSGRLREDYSNGRSYYPLHGAPMRMPTSLAEQPAPEFIQWHNEHAYLG
jgi:putative restriction endonuclease